MERGDFADLKDLGVYRDLVFAENEFVNRDIFLFKVSVEIRSTNVRSASLIQDDLQEQ